MNPHNDSYFEWGSFKFLGKLFVQWQLYNQWYHSKLETLDCTCLIKVDPSVLKWPMARSQMKIVSEGRE